MSLFERNFLKNESNSDGKPELAAPTQTECPTRTCLAREADGRAALTECTDQLGKLVVQSRNLLQDPNAEFARKVLIGFTAGTLACCVNIPFDVAKSRIQGPQPVTGNIKYKGTFRAIFMVYKEEGYVKSTYF